MRRSLKLVLVAVVVGVLAAWLTCRYAPRELTRQELIVEAQAGHIRSVVIEDKTITGVSSTRGRFRTVVADDDTNLAGELKSRGVQVFYEKSSPGPLF